MYPRSRERRAAALFTILLLAALLALLLFPVRCRGYLLNGVMLWAVNVLPAALPFLFLTAMFAQTPLFFAAAKKLAPFFRLFGVSGAGGCAALLSLLSGYPAGAKAVERLCAGGLAREERLRCACLASTSGPAFLVGVLGAALTGRPALGWLLFFAHVCGIFGISFLLGRRRSGAEKTAALPAAQRITLPEALSSAVLSVLTVGGAVALFSLFGNLLSDLLALLHVPAVWRALLTGLVEMTAGCHALLADPAPVTLALCAFLVTFGGACVLVQQWSFLQNTGIRPWAFLLVKALQGVLAALVCLLLAPAFGV